MVNRPSVGRRKKSETGMALGYDPTRSQRPQATKKTLGRLARAHFQSDCVFRDLPPSSGSKTFVSKKGDAFFF